MPFLIDWGSTPHTRQAVTYPPPLTSWTAVHPTPRSLQGPLLALGYQLDVAARDRPALTAVINGDHGLVTLT
jgi:hypothetical protein